MKALFMKTLLALLLLIPSLSWGKDLSGNKLWCSPEYIVPGVGPTYQVLDFINDGLVYWYQISKYGIKKGPADYDVHSAYISVRNQNSYFRIDRKTLKISENTKCDIVDISNTDEYVKDYFYKEFESKNKL